MPLPQQLWAQSAWLQTHPKVWSNLIHLLFLSHKTHSGLQVQQVFSIPKKTANLIILLKQTEAGSS